MNRRAAGDIIQFAGLVVTGVGCGIELYTHESWGFIVITAGSIVFAIACKVKGE